MLRRVRILSAFLPVLLLGCTAPMPVDRFGGTEPDFDPMRFFTGHVASWGVLENRSGAPTEIVTTDCVGRIALDGSLAMVQHLMIGHDEPVTREWRMRRVSAHHYVATANDMVGRAEGDTAGRVMHWQWVWARPSGHGLANLRMSQWFYAMPDHSVMVRTTISKLGITLAGVTEHFAQTP